MIFSSSTNTHRFSFFNKLFFYSLAIILSQFLVMAKYTNKVLAANALDDIQSGADNVGGSTGLTNTPATDLIGKIILSIISFIGVIFLVLIILSGFKWMTAGGNSEAIKKAKDQIIRAIVGLAIILLAFFITSFIINQVFSL